MASKADIRERRRSAVSGDGEGWGTLRGDAILDEESCGNQDLEDGE